MIFFFNGLKNPMDKKRESGFRQKDGGRSVGIRDLHLMKFNVIKHFLSHRKSKIVNRFS